MGPFRARALLLADSPYGGNWLLNTDKPSIQGRLESYGWIVETASPLGWVDPCAWAAARGFRRRRTEHRTAELGDPLVWNTIIVLPGQAHEALLMDEAALRLIRGLAAHGGVVAAFCRGVRVLARAGVLQGRWMTGHEDYAGEYEAAGARYIGYRDLRGKRDAPLPVVDGNLVTGMRSNALRLEICDAIRDAVEGNRSRHA